MVPRQAAHIKARRHGGPDDPSNLRLLCDSCHSRETVAEFGFGRQTVSPCFSDNCEGVVRLRNRSVHRNLPRREIGKFFFWGDSDPS